MRVKRKGQALVEFALAVPLLMLIFCGVMEFGWLYYQLFYMNAAVRSAARVLAEQPSGAGDNSVATRIYLEMRGPAPAVTPHVAVYPVTFSGTGANMVAQTGTALADNSLRPNNHVITVTASSPYIPLFGLVDPRAYGIPANLRATYTFAIVQMTGP